jgi:alginate O-acetyltransferase complex protein AlgI
MLFNSYEFIFGFLPISLIGFYLLARYSHKAAALWLLMVSLFFYGWWQPASVPLLVGSAAFNFAMGNVIFRRRQAGAAVRIYLTGGIAANLLLLGYYKYQYFLGGLIGLSLEKAVMPLGISFFTFTQIAYLIDVSRRVAWESKPIHYGLFVTYFPHLLSGPILHHAQMMPQFARPWVYRFCWGRFTVGLFLLGVGLFKKVVLADNISVYVDRIFSLAETGESMTMLESWCGAIAYTMQIYFDFSGYSDAAVGMSLMFGIRLPINFFSPYRATSIIEFWRRWHMTLSRFLRDYLYIPLGGNRHGPGRRHLNLLITMVLGGFWHGAGWTFIIWGGLHGLYLLTAHLWRDHVSIKLPRVIGWGMTFTAVVIAWVWFRAATVDGALALLQGMAGWNGLVLPAGLHKLAGPLAPVLNQWGVQFDSTRIGYLMPSPDQMLILACMSVIAVAAPNCYQLLRRYRPALEVGHLAAGGWRWRPTAGWAAFTGLLFFFVLVSLGQVSEFLYFNF